MLDRISEVERLAAVAMHGANRPLSIKRWRRYTMPFNPKVVKRHSEAIQLERATIRTMHFYNRINQTILYLLRQMEMTKAYATPELGKFPTLLHWARVRLAPVANDDKIDRLCATTLKVIAPLDATPVITADGEKITGLSLIVSASPSALIRVAGTFSNSTNGERDRLAEALMSGNSNDRQLKAITGWTPKMGKALAQFQQTADDEVYITIRATNVQARSIETQLSWMLEIRMDSLQ